MIGALSHRDRVAVLVGSIGIAAIIGGGKGLPALRRWEADISTRAVQAGQQLQNAQHGVATLRETRDSAVALDRRLSVARSDMILATTPEAAAAALAAMVEQLAEDEGVRVGTLTLRPDTVVRAGMARAGIRISAEGDVEGLAGLLYALESGDTTVSVTELTVSQAEPAAPSSRQEVLRIEMLLVTQARIQAVAPVTRRDP
jgi:hypothetical protein